MALNLIDRNIGVIMNCIYEIQYNPHNVNNTLIQCPNGNGALSKLTFNPVVSKLIHNEMFVLKTFSYRRVSMETNQNCHLYMETPNLAVCELIINHKQKI